MTYCLMTEDKLLRVEIYCSATNRPDTVDDLVQGIRAKTIELAIGSRLPKMLPMPTIKLETDWERTGTGLRQMNWIATENL